MKVLLTQGHPSAKLRPHAAITRAVVHAAALPAAGHTKKQAFKETYFTAVTSHEAIELSCHEAAWRPNTSPPNTVWTHISGIKFAITMTAKWRPKATKYRSTWKSDPSVTACPLICHQGCDQTFYVKEHEKARTSPAGQ